CRYDDVATTLADAPTFSSTHRSTIRPVSARAPDIRIAEPGAYLIAFSRRLANTCSIRRTSTHTAGSAPRPESISTGESARRARTRSNPRLTRTAGGVAARLKC